MTSASRTTAGHVHPQGSGQHRRWYVEHRPFLCALLLGAALRLVVQIAFSPGLVFADGVYYLGFLKTFVPSPDRPDGYSLVLLYPLSLLTSKVILAAALVQHALGLSTAAVLYAMLRRWGVGRWLATLATLPVLFDALQLILEQSVLSDTLFVLLLMLVFAALGWRERPTAALALIAGLLLGAAVTIRLVGEPLIITSVAFCLLVGQGWRDRFVPAVALLLGFLVPVSAYASFYHHEHGVYALSQFGGKSLWLRSTTFVDCSRVSVPPYQQVLCPSQPLGQRLDPTYYGWHDPQALARLNPPAGTTPYQAMGEFARAAITAQPFDYARIALRDFALNFDPVRIDRFTYDTAYKWHFSHYVAGWAESARQIRLYRAYGGQRLSIRQPYANVLAGYSWVGYLPGPLLLGCLSLGLVGGLAVRKARTSGSRSLCLLLTVSGTVLLLVPDMTAEFVWRYQLPALVLLPAGAALGLSALREDRLVKAATGKPSTPTVTLGYRCTAPRSPTDQSLRPRERP